MVIDKVILTQDIRLFKDAEILRMSMSVEMIKARIKNLGYKFINNAHNKKVLNDIENGIDVELNSRMKFTVEGVLIKDEFIPIQNVPTDIVEFSLLDIKVPKKQTLTSDEVEILEQKGLIDFLKEFNSEDEIAMKVQSNKSISVLMNDTVTNINIPIDILMPRPVYKSQYTSDEKYLKIVIECLKANIDEIGDDAFKSIKSIIGKGVI